MLPEKDNRIRRIIAAAIFFVLAAGQLLSQKTILDSTYTFRYGILKTGSALNTISRQTGYSFTYDSRLIDQEKKILFSFEREKLDLILDSIVGSDSLAYTVIDKYIIISRIPSEKAISPGLNLSGELFYITGKITDAETREPLPYATISVKNKGKGTISNASGEFGLKISEESISDTLSVSYLGYLHRQIPARQAIGNDFTISLIREFIPIPEIIIKTQVPQEIIYRCISQIEENYGSEPSLLTCFYREGVTKKSELQVYSEAIIKIYKSSYSNTLLGDQVRIFKSRKIENISIKDTLAIRLKAGLGTSLELDGMKNLFDFIKKENIADYKFRITDIISFGDESAYAIEFEQREGIDLPLFRGTMYINTDDFAMMKSDFELHPDFIIKMKESFISKSSRGFDTWPVTVKYSVTYRKINNRYFLNHVRGDLVFTSKKKKKLFSNQFNVFFELAVTDIKTENVSRFEREELAPIHSVFSKSITSYDSNFWGDLDFLRPEDNLLQELENMKARLQEFSEEK